MHRSVPGQSSAFFLTSVLSASILASSLVAQAQTAPPTPEVSGRPVPPAPASAAPPAALPAPTDAAAPAGPPPQSWATALDDFRALKERLPFGFGAGVYIFYYQPLSNQSILSGSNPDGSAPGSYDGSLNVYAFYLKFDKQIKGFGGHAEIRMRDGGHIGSGASNDYLRGFFSSNLWFQEVYAYYTPGPYLKISAGKMYRKVGIFWDDSFWGNLLYFDGLKLNPDYGVSIEGEATGAGGKLALNYVGQYFYNSDGINGGLDAGRRIGSAPRGTDLSAVREYTPSPEGQLDSAGNRIGSLHHVVNGRVGLKLQPVKQFSAEAGVSGLFGNVQRTSTVDAINDYSQFKQAAVDLTLIIGPITVFGEFLHQFGPAVRDTDYGWTGIRGSIGPVALRFSASYANYSFSSGPQVEEFNLLPGVTVKLPGGVALIAEYDEWRRRDPRILADYYTYDRSLSLVANYTY